MKKSNIQQIPKEWPSWMTEQQREHLIRRRFEQLLQDEEIIKLLDEYINIKTIELQRTIKDLKHELNRACHN